MKITVMPCATKPRSVWKSSRLSCGVSTAVGSSRMMVRAPRTSTFRISMRCSMPTESRPTRSVGSTVQAEAACDSSRVFSICARVVDQAVPADLHAEKDVLGDGERRHQLEMLVHHAEPGRDGHRRIGHRRSAGRRSRISPSSGWRRPNRTFISVVLPAPFSPMMAWISPPAHAQGRCGRWRRMRRNAW